MTGIVLAVMGSYATAAAAVVSYIQTQKGIIFGGWGSASTIVSTAQLITSAGVVGNDITTTGTAGRAYGSGTTYGADKGIFVGGFSGSVPYTTMACNLVSNIGTIASDTTGAASSTNRSQLAATGYGSDLAIVLHGTTGVIPQLFINYITNIGAIGADVSNAINPLEEQIAVRIGSGKAFHGFGGHSEITPLTTSNIISATGVIGTNSTMTNQPRQGAFSTTYGATGTALVTYGVIDAFLPPFSFMTLLSNTGVISADSTVAGTPRVFGVGLNYGLDKGILCCGLDAYNGNQLSLRNLVSNTGVVASNTSIAGGARDGQSGLGFSTVA